MSAPDHAPPTDRRPRLTFRGGGWVIVLMLTLCAAVVLWAFSGVIMGSRPVGDGADPASYGFDLSRTDFRGATLTATGNARDFLSALDDPRTAPGREILEINRQERGKYLVTTDRVIGVVIDGEARAYPLRLLNAHEVCNDTLGGVPIAVTYSPLCDSVAVWHRRLGEESAAPRVVRFGVSGLVLDSNLLMYDRDEQAGAGPEAGPRSLWSQLEGRAVAGPDAVADGGAPLRLRAIPGVQLVTWTTWLSHHPETTVVLKGEGDGRRIRQIDYGRYWARGVLLYEASRAPDAATLEARGLTLMTPSILVTVQGGSAAFPLPEIVAAATGGAWRTQVAGREITFIPGDDGRTAWVAAGDAELRYGLWFALEPLAGGDGR